VKVGEYAGHALHPEANMDLRFALLLVCFFVSGFAALLYQTAWTREFAFLFGTSELAVVAVLAAYMGGLAFGAAMAARFVRRLTRPVLAYGLLELGIAVGALCVPTLIRLVQSMYISFAGGLEAPPETMALTTAVFHLIGSFIVLVPCTALMGATLPLLARYAVSDDAQIGPRIGVLYAVNTFGAIGGTLVAAFYLLPQFGLRQTVYLGILGNVVVFLAAAALARGIAGMPPEPDVENNANAKRFHWILPAMTLSGAVSFLYEVLWTRLLGQVLGGSTAAFASMLSSFLLGIALGSALASRFATTRAAAARGFAVAQLGSGLLGYAAFRGADYLPNLALAVGANPASPASGAAAAGIVLLPVTLCIGATFPFAVRLLAQDADEAASVSGRVYAWNTVGSIIGAVLAGFVLLPELGLENTALVGVLTSLLLAIAAAWFIVPRRPVLVGLATASLIAAAVVGLPSPERLLMHSAISGQKLPGSLYYLGVGRSATVTVVEGQTGWRLLTNGLPESGVDRAEVPNMRPNETAWLSLLPTATRPETEEMLIIGLGGAKTLEATARTVSSIDVIELEEEVVIANQLMPRAVDPLADPRVSLRLGDARGAMHLTDKVYDAIVSQPSHPWTSGASHLYTREFFELTQSKLEPGGIFVQWIGLGFVDIPLFGSLMAAMTDVFDYVHVYRPVPAALVFVASDDPIDLFESGSRAIAAAPEDFGIQGIHRVEDLLATWSLDSDAVKVLATGRPSNTDDHNRLATTRLPPAQQNQNHRKFADHLLEHEPWSPERLASIDAALLVRRMSLNGETGRARRIAATLPEPAKSTALGWLNFDTGRRARAHRFFKLALEMDPSHTTARAGFIRSHPVQIIKEPEIDWTQAEQVALDAQNARAADEWKALTGLDQQLGEIAPGNPLYGTAVIARAQWRLSTGEKAKAQEAIDLLDALLTRQRTGDTYLLRAQAGAIAGDMKLAWAALEHLSTSRFGTTNISRRAMQIARSLGPPPEGSQVLQRLAQRIQIRR
jgi:spermidine synthase